MRVLHIETGMNLYGGALQVFYLLRGLHARGVDNLLVCPCGSAIAVEARPYAKVIELPMRGEVDLIFGWRLLQTLRRERPDLVHAHSRRGADLWGAIAARIAGIPALVTRRVDNPEAPWLARLKYRQFAHVITISQGIRDVLLGEGVPADHVTCVHSAVDIDAWQGEPDRAWINREFNLPDDSQVVAVIAQLIERKGHRFLFEAIPRILEKVPNAYFLVLGKGPLETELKELCKTLQIESHVIFAGFRDDLQRIMPCLDLVVHPALMEGLGVSLLQAAACGIPIVAGRAGGIPEIVEDGVNGYLVEPGNSEELIIPVTQLLLNPDDNSNMGQQGREIVQKWFSIDAMVSSNMNCYEKFRKI